MLRFYLNLLLFALLILPEFAHGQALVTLTNSEAVYPLKEAVLVLEDPEGKLTIDDITHPSINKQFAEEQRDLSYGFTSYTYWFKFRVQNMAAPQTQWLFEEAYPLLDYINLYQLDSNGNWAVTEMGDYLPFSQRELPCRYFVTPLLFHSQEVHTFYFKAHTTSSLRLPIAIRSLPNHHQNNAGSSFIYGLYYGILVVMFIYNLLIFLSLRDISYFYYIISILFTLLLFSAVSGHAVQYLWKDNIWWGNLSVPLSMGGVAIGSALFARTFLEVSKYSKGWYYTLNVIIISGFAVIFACFFMGYAVAIIMGTANLIIDAVVLLSTGIVCWLKGNKAARYYVIAWATYLVSAFMVLLVGYGVLPSHAFFTHAVEVGSSVEVMLLAFALSDRISIIRKEKALLQKEALAMQQEANQKLEQKVHERTKEINDKNEKLRVIATENAKNLERSEELLLNILPASIAKELQEKGVASPTYYPAATTLFTDFQGFSQIAEKLDSAMLVQELNEIFSAFDDICERFGVEKIKTIGDAYMAVGGVPTVSEQHALQVVKASHEMQEYMERREGAVSWKLRIGIHTGPIVAGVVGKKKFAYDVWGDSVNIAARMESSGKAGRVNISGETYQLIKNYFACEYRGKIVAKNKGEIDMYFVEKSNGLV